MYLALKKILQMHGLLLVFLCETKLKTMHMNEVNRQLNYENCFVVSSNGKGGGLALLWNLGTKVQIKSFNKHHIDAEIVMENGKLIRCTGVYDHPDMRQRKHTWILLRWLSGLSSTPWFCFGDFNEILHIYEKSGGNERQLSLITDFREALRDCNLLDVSYKRYPFT